MEKLDRSNLVKDFNSSSSVFFSTKLIFGLIGALLLGIGTGYFLNSNPSTISKVRNSVTSKSVQKGAIEGSNDTATFKDIAEGKMKEGGIEGEGAFHLERPGGESQNVYLTSSTVDLGKYIGRKVKVWGETQKAQHAGWLMDVGRLEVLE